MFKYYLCCLFAVLITPLKCYYIGDETNEGSPETNYLLDIESVVKQHESQLSSIYDVIIGYYRSKFYAIGGRLTSSSSTEIRVASIDSIENTGSTSVVDNTTANVSTWESLGNWGTVYTSIQCQSCYTQVANYLYILAPGASSDSMSSMLVFDMKTQVFYDNSDTLATTTTTTNIPVANDSNLTIEDEGSTTTEEPYFFEHAMTPYYVINETNYYVDSIPFYYPCVVNNGKKIFSLGGMTNDANQNGVNTTLIYNIKQDKWSYGEDMPTARVFTQCVIETTYDNYIFVFGGLSSFTSGNVLNTIEMYDIEQNKWFDVTRDLTNTPSIGSVATIFTAKNDNGYKYEMIVFIGGSNVDWTRDLNNDESNNQDNVLLIWYHDKRYLDSRRNVSLIDVSNKYTISYDTSDLFSNNNNDNSDTSNNNNNNGTLLDVNETTAAPTGAPTKVPTVAPTPITVPDYAQLTNFGFYQTGKEKYLIGGLTNGYSDYSSSIFKMSISAEFAGM